MEEKSTNVKVGLQNVIGGKHQLTEDFYALSLVRRKNQEHAYLILEGIDNAKRIIQDIHLVVKDNSDNKKADIVYRDISLEQLQHIGKDCNAYTWTITKKQAVDLLAIVQSDKHRADKNEIDYVVTGETPIGGWLGDSMDSADSEESKKGLENSSQNPSSQIARDLLLRKGHSCMSWAVEKLKSINLNTPTSWITFVVVIPPLEIRGQKNMDNYEPTTKNPCVVM